MNLFGILLKATLPHRIQRASQKNIQIKMEQRSPNKTHTKKKKPNMKYKLEYTRFIFDAPHTKQQIKQIQTI